MDTTSAVRIVLGIVAVGCVVASSVWGRSSLRQQRAWRRIAGEVSPTGAGAEAADLVRSAFR
ncbi:MAG TPA: hypothetical protein VNY84_07930 [Acidimicrobiales bacterium]|nr:hypothetical protein [Acidimicrobiales bacterium]